MLFLCQLSFGQSSPATGAPPFSTIQSTGFDSIDLANLNIHFRIPIRHRASATLPFNSDLTYNSLIWGDDGLGDLVPTNGYGWRSDTEALGGKVTYSLVPKNCLSGTGNLYTNLPYKDSHGTVHPSLLVPDSCQAPISYTAGTTDGSGYSILVSIDSNRLLTSTVKSRSGLTIGGTGFTVTDPNGNQLSTNGTTFTDTLATATSVLALSGTNPVSYTYAGPSGNVSITKNYTSNTVLTNFACSDANYSHLAVLLPSSIVLPGGNGQYNFTYEQITGGTNARIKSVQLPTGGTITYAYSGGSVGMNCSDFTTNTLTRTTPDGVWTYVHTPPATGSTISTTKVTDPLGNQTIYTFSGSTAGISGQYEVLRQVYQGSSTLLATTTTCYNGASTNCASAKVTLPITEKDVYTQLAGQTISSRSASVYNAHGLLTTNEFFADGTNLTVVNGIAYADGAPGNCPALGSFMVDRPCVKSIYDGNSNRQAETDFQYDSHGNTTQVSYFTGSHSLTSVIVPNGNGTVLTNTSPAGGVTRFSYGCGNGQLPTGVSQSSGTIFISVSPVPNCDGSVNTSVTDENGKITTLQYADATGIVVRQQHTR